MRQALEQGDINTAREENERLNDRLDAIKVLAGGSVGLLQRVGATMGEEQDGSTAAQEQAIISSLEAISQQRVELGSLDADQAGYG